MLYDDKAFYIFVSDDEYHNKKMYYRSNELNGRLIISYYKKDDHIVDICTHFPLAAAAQRDI